MKTKHIVLLAIVLLMACNNDDGPVVEEQDLTEKPDSTTESEKSHVKQITGFAFRAADNDVLEADVIGSIDHEAKTVFVTVPTGTDVTALTPEIELSPNASVSPEGATSFENSLNYTVTAEDGTTAIYSTMVQIALSGEKQILSFRFEGINDNGTPVDIDGAIDEATKSITATMPSGTDITALEPIIEVSPVATLDLDGPQDFTKPLNYKVTAEDGTSVPYAITITVTLTEKEILLLISDANPGNNLGWNKNMDIKDFEEVTLDGNGRVIELDLGLQSLAILPPEIGQLTALEYLGLTDNFLTEIPEEIGQLNTLETLELEDNKFQELPAEIGQLNNLEVLYLSSNKLKELPPEIWQLNNLKFLSLADIGLQELPSGIWQLNNLEILILYDNSLKELPAEIGQLNKLRSLFLSSNDLKELPSEIEQLSNLDYLDLRSQQNGLGYPPKTLGNLTNLQNLFLSGNGLDALPVEVCKLSKVYGGICEIDIIQEVLCVL